MSAVRDARRLLRPFHGELVSLLRALVRTDSVAVPPDGNETAAQRVLEAWLKRKRVPVETYDTAFLERSKHPARRGRTAATAAGATSSRAHPGPAAAAACC